MADKSHRIQRKRVKGWTMPENTIYVGRQNRKPGTGFGNPFNWLEYGGWTDAERKRLAKRDFRSWLDGKFVDVFPEQRQWILDHEHELSGNNVACWCGLDEPCHADVYLERQEVKHG